MKTSHYVPDFLVWELGRWANDMWVRFGGEGVRVYLVGSAIHNANHKDEDDAIARIIEAGARVDG